VVGELHRDMRELLVGLIEGGLRRRRGLDGELGRTTAMTPAGTPACRGKLGSSFFGR